MFQIFGMGMTENDTYSDSLRGVYLPVVSDERCVKEQRVDFRKYIRYTSFCAGWKNGDERTRRCKYFSSVDKF